MSVFKKKDLIEMVGGDISAGGSDRNPVNNSEIETGPVEKPFNDDSDYEKGIPPTSDKIFGRYRQDIPWFAVYSFGGVRNNATINTYESKVLTKKNVEEKIEDLVKKSKDVELTEKGYNPKISKLIDTINDTELTEKQLEDLKKAILNKQKSKNI